jgi:hypothetical protein
MTASDDEDDDGAARRDREAILARRQRFVVAALAGLTTSTLATACRPQPCLRMVPIDVPGDREAETRARSPAAEALAAAELEGHAEAAPSMQTPTVPGSPTRE